MKLEEIEIRKSTWDMTSKNDKKKFKDGTRILKVKTVGGGGKWYKVFWRQ